MGFKNKMDREMSGVWPIYFFLGFLDWRLTILIVLITPSLIMLFCCRLTYFFGIEILADKLIKVVNHCSTLLFDLFILFAFFEFTFRTKRVILRNKYIGCNT